MKTLSSSVDNEKDAASAAMTELYDIYLKAAITGPFGTTSVLRLTLLPGGISFFRPQLDPEPLATRGQAQTYSFWPLAREESKTELKSVNDKFTFTASNVTAEFAQMLAGVDWYDTPVVVRKIFHSIATATADDCLIVFIGLIDRARITNQSIQFSCSNDLANLNTIAPRENMHTNCRHNWGDDLCTAPRLKSTNYKAGTVGSSSTTTHVNSSGLTEDGASSGSYGTDLVDALANGAITASSEATALSGVSVISEGFFTSPIRLSSHDLQVGTAVTFAGTLPSPLSAGPTYYVRRVLSGDQFTIATTPGGTELDLGGTGDTFTVSTVYSRQASEVKSSQSSWWQINGAGDLGTNDQGYWRIPDEEAGLANPELKPFITFDFGSAKTPRVWRLSSVPDLSTLDGLPRLLVFFSSVNGSIWQHETYFEMPPVGGVLYDVLIPSAATKRYWRICVRSRWGQQTTYTMLNKVCAYENARHYWAGGQIRFRSGTTTAALRNVVRRVVESYSGAVVVSALPSAPVSGDTFVIERGCGRSFNACSERCNWENFGGFTTLPYQTVIR